MIDTSTWISVESIPENFKKIIMTDGKITDTGFHLGMNWYLDNHYKIIGEITHWKYV